MQTVSRLGMVFVFASALVFAETWTGKLVDAATCDVQQQQASSPQQQPPEQRSESAGQSQQRSDTPERSESQPRSDMPQQSDSTMLASNCMPTSSTTTFALVTTDQKMYKFDANGNKKAAEAFKKSESGAERSSNPNEQRPAERTATVKGTMSANEIAVDSIEVH